MRGTFTAVLLPPPPQENEAREAADRQRRQRQELVCLEKKKRRSIATCSARDPGLLGVELDPLLLGAAPPSGQRGRFLRGLPLPSDSPQAPGRPLPLGRRHTLTALAPRPEPLAPPPKAPPSQAKRAGGLFGQGLRALLRSPPATPCTEPHPLPEAPATPKSFRLPHLFQKKPPPGGAETPTVPPASPKEGSGLAGLFRRLSTGEKPQQPSPA